MLPQAAWAAATIEPKGFDSGGIAAAIRQAAEGDTVRFPAGVFEATDSIRLKSGVKLIGAGQDKTRIVYWGYNTIRDCAEWGAQFQGESGGITHHYLYRCAFENTVLGDSRAWYPNDSGHGFRFNGACRDLVLDECTFRNNGGLGVQIGGKDVDGISFLRCTITGNSSRAVTPPAQYTALEFVECRVETNRDNELPAAKPLSSPPPKADFSVPGVVRAGEPAAFRCNSAATTEIAERLWDFGHGIPEVTAEPKHTYERPGKYRVTLIVWDKAGRGARAEKTIEVLR